MALTWHGPATVLMLEPKTWPARLAIGTAAGALGYAGTVFTASRSPMTRAQAYMCVDLGYRGIVFAHGLDAVFKFGPNPRRVLGLWLASVAGQAGGYFAARGMTTGQVTTAITYTDLAIVEGFFVATIANDVVFHGSTWSSAPSWGSIPGTVLGFGAGMLCQRGSDGTEGQAALAWCGGLTGAFVPGAVYFAARGRNGLRDQTVMSALGMAGSVAGAVLTGHLVHSRPVSASQACAVLGTTVAGLLLGGGLGLAVAQNGRGVAAGSVAGALVGQSCGLVTVLGRPAATRDDGRVRINVQGLAGAVVALVAVREFAVSRFVVLGF